MPEPYNRFRQFAPPRKRTGLARAMSKLGLCSRSQAHELIKAGRVKVNGVVRTGPEWPVAFGIDRIEFDQRAVQAAARAYLMLNKRRGLVTTTADEKGRPTVYQCLAGKDFSRLLPVGRLDKASEGLLLFTNDNEWAARITSPGSRIEKIYHVQIDRLAQPELIQRLLAGVACGDDCLRAAKVTLLRSGSKNCWLEIALNEGKNRHIRRMLQALDIEVMRLIRVRIGPLSLGDLPKGGFRQLTAAEVAALRFGAD